MTRRIPELNLRRFPEMFKIIPDEIVLQFPQLVQDN